jgi:hypothetical protein
MPQGIADKTNQPLPLQYPGDLGQEFIDPMTNKLYRRVVLDSGATSATPTGVVAANQLAFWKDPSNSLVTNDIRMTDLSFTGSGTNPFLNRVAGVFRNAVTAGNYCDVVIKGSAVPVKSDGSGAAGDFAVVSTAAGTAQVTALSAPNTAPTSQVIGLIRAAASGGSISVDVNITQFGF